MTPLEQARDVLEECRAFFDNCPSYDGADTNNLDTRCGDVIEALTAALASLEAAGGGVEPTLSNARILHLWDTHVAYETNVNRPQQPPLTNKDKLAFARAVLSVALCRYGLASPQPKGPGLPQGEE